MKTYHELQWLWQILGLVITIGIASVFGFATGIVLVKVFGHVTDDGLFRDDDAWIMPVADHKLDVDSPF